ncbi:ThuA domain-containing protein [Niastella populi]|uniref:Crp/Fnr family transcriptional regulator n=1 Tax=Niastella populi TaxID=550983 RepID=A0A1V9G6L2_9BACT|nr:ThuA domain-containing protein [Niastella populi]OQP66210.1 Crp/Fnr family transcriptional regulator [Niastella populi]
MNKYKKTIACFLFTFVTLQLVAQKKINWKKLAVLVYTRNGPGYVHANIPAAVSCIQKLGRQYGFLVDTSGNPAVMTEGNLKRYNLVIFPSTNNDVFDNETQRLAFRRYIEAGGGFVGIHSVLGTERNWKWFKMMLGGSFAWHPRFQKLTVKTIDTKHSSVQGIPKNWIKEDEMYFARELYPGPKVVMAFDMTSLTITDTAQTALIKKHAGGYAELYPAVWVNDYDGGYTWCSVLGHDAKDYSEPVFVQHIMQGIRYVAGRAGVKDYSKAYAVTYDEPVKY